MIVNKPGDWWPNRMNPVWATHFYKMSVAMSRSTHYLKRGDKRKSGKWARIGLRHQRHCHRTTVFLP